MIHRDFDNILLAHSRYADRLTWLRKQITVRMLILASIFRNSVFSNQISLFLVSKLRFINCDIWRFAPGVLEYMCRNLDRRNKLLAGLTTSGWPSPRSTASCVIVLTRRSLTGANRDMMSVSARAERSGVRLFGLALAVRKCSRDRSASGPSSASCRDGM